MIICDISLFVYGSKPGNHFGRNLREFAFASLGRAGGESVNCTGYPAFE